MEYKKLGKTNLKISVLGFGGCPIGGHGWGEVDDNDSVEAIKKAMNLGINFFDTADTYGLGHSEEVLAKALGDCRRKMVISTKGGVRFNPEKKKSVHDLSPDYLAGAIEGSLKRLKLDSIPLYFLHYPDQKTPIEKTMEILNKFQKQGKIQNIGCSNFSAAEIIEAQKYGRIEALQTSYNILDRDSKKFIFPVCEKYEMSIFIYGPLAQGLLAGKIDEKTKFGKDDRRSGRAYKNFHGERFKANLKIVKELKNIAAKYNKTTVQAAIRWILDDDLVTNVILGIKKPEEIQENIGALDWSFDLADRDFIVKTVVDNYKKFKV